MAVYDKLEQTDISLAIALKKGKLKTGTKAQFKFKAVDPSGKALTLPKEVAEPEAVEVLPNKGLFKRGGSMTITVKPPTVASLGPSIEYYKLSYTYKIGTKDEVAVADEYKVWPKQIKVTVFKQGATDKLPDVELRQKGKSKGVKTNAQGVANVEAGEYEPTEITPGPGHVFKWKTGKDKGAEREAEAHKVWVAKITKPVKPTGSDPYKQYVNLTAGAKVPDNSGDTLELEVGPKETTDKAYKDDKVKIKCTYSKLGKRDVDPKPKLLEDGVTDYKASSDGKTFTGTITVPADDGKAKFKVQLGRSGGETWTIKVGTSDAVDDDTIKVETWRRVYLQVSRPNRLALPALDKFKSCMQEVFIEVAGLTEKTLSDTDDVPVWMDGKYCGQTDGTKYLLAGDTTPNEAKYEALLAAAPKVVDSDKKKEGEEPPPNLRAHLLLCDEQVDFKDDKTFDQRLSASKVTKTKTDVQRPKSGGGGDEAVKRITAFSWRPGKEFFARDKEDAAHPIREMRWAGGGKNGSFPLDKITVTYNTQPKVSVDASADKEFQDAAEAGDMEVAVRYQMAEVFNGEAFGDRGRHLLVSGRFGGRAAAEVCGTMAHELGHALNMCLSDDYPGVKDLAAARDDHERHYELSGNHCATGLAEGPYNTAVGDDNWDPHTGVCKCVMFGIGGSDRSNSYCAKCADYYKAHDLTEFK